jgi:hypothetical protein
LGQAERFHFLIAVALAGYKNAAKAMLSKDALLWNLDIAEKLGCLSDDRLAGDETRQRSHCDETVPILPHTPTVSFRLTQPRGDFSELRIRSLQSLLI